MENLNQNPETNTTQTERPKQMKIYAIGVLLIFGAYFLGYVNGTGALKYSDGKVQITRGDVPSYAADYSLLWDALDIINSKFVDRPLDQQKLMYGAVAGMVAATGDPYTAFLDPEQARAFNEQLQGSFEGIGAEVGTKDGQIVVVAPLDDTPAQRAGLLAGDIIIGINDESTIGMSVDQAVSKIRGKAGTDVKLTVLHPGTQEPQEITITRAQIEIKSVTFETKTIAGTDQKIAVIKINQFGDDTKGLLNQMVDSVATGNYAGLVLDLRNNPGGYLETAVTTISHWIDAGQPAVVEKGYSAAEKDYKTVGIPRLKGVKTVVLVNGGSASASEIVAGALQDYKAATLVGTKTFGKGSVQELQDLKGNAEIKVTVAKWYTPNGRGIHEVGLEPDVIVEITAEDTKAEKDPQMDKALELLK